MTVTVPTAVAVVVVVVIAVEKVCGSVSANDDTVSSCVRVDDDLRLTRDEHGVLRWCGRRSAKLT